MAATTLPLRQLQQCNPAALLPMLRLIIISAKCICHIPYTSLSGNLFHLRSHLLPLTPLRVLLLLLLPLCR
jgi:hypothetical protein